MTAGTGDGDGTGGRADALVVFGATGDLAEKQIFPALCALVGRGELDVPIVGVALSGWTLDDLRDRATESVTAHGGDPAALQRLLGLLRYVDGDYQDPATFAKLRTELAGATRVGGTRIESCPVERERRTPRFRNRSMDLRSVSGSRSRRRRSARW